MFRELRRKSLQLERGALEKFRSERRGSLSDKAEKSAVGPLPPRPPQGGHHHDKSERRGSLVSR